MSKIIAIEGPSYAGKSSLIDSLQNSLPNLLTLPCYVDFAGGDEMVPRAPAQSREEELSVFNYFLTLDEIRGRRYHQTAERIDNTILDRSPYTLLAHKYAIEKIKKWDVFRASVDQATNDPRLLWPELVIFLNVTNEILANRYPEGKHSLFMSNEYNRHFNRFFLRSLEPKPPSGLYVVDGDAHPSEVFHDVSQIILG